MKNIKRATIAIYRQPVKSAIFLILIIILGVLTSGAISVRQAVINTERNLRNRMPSVVSVVQDFDYPTILEIYETTGVWPSVEIKRFTPELIREIGDFPQVRTYDFAIDLSWGVSGRNLSMWENPHFLSPNLGEYDENLGVRMRIRGVSNPNFLETREGLVELESGRSFTDFEMYDFDDIYPALIASGFARTNDLDVGSIFNVQVVVFENGLYGDVIFEESFPLEVVGIFNPIFREIDENALVYQLFQADREQIMMQHRVYVPNAVAELMFNVRAQNNYEMDEVFLHNFFILNDPMDFHDFSAEIQNLPGSWRVMDLSASFFEISASMENLLELADFVYFISIVATLLVTTLLLLLILHERKNEIGIYLALGEKKRNIVGQMLFELMPIAIVGMVAALFLGNLLASSISQEMIREDLIRGDSVRLYEGNLLEELGYRFEMTHEEMLESYSVNINVGGVVLFVATGSIVILISTAMPIYYLTSLNPKKVLLQDS